MLEASVGGGVGEVDQSEMEEESGLSIELEMEVLLRVDCGGISVPGNAGGISRPDVRKKSIGEAKLSKQLEGWAKRSVLRLCRVCVVQILS